MKTKSSKNRYLYILIIIFTAILIWSGIKPHDYYTWILEVLPALLGLAVLAITFKRFQFTNFIYTCILIHSAILMLGGHYTYAEEPFFKWLKEVLGWSRNNYDKVGHIAQGFFPALIIREIFIRTRVFNKKGWMNFSIVSICLAISAVYELIEAGVSMLSGESADAFLGTQGYVWDTQTDMFCALIGAIAALLLLSKIHSKQINRIQENV